MADEEILESRKRLGIQNSKESSATVKDQNLGKECEANNCHKTAISKCSHCGRSYCNTHLDPRITTSAMNIWSMDQSDPVKYNKYQEDWQKKDGHSCPAYTEWWIKDHESKQNYGTTPKWAGSSGGSYKDHSDYGDKNTYNTTRVKVSKSNNNKMLIIAGIIIILFIAFIIYSNRNGIASLNNNNSPNTNLFHYPSLNTTSSASTTTIYTTSSSSTSTSSTSTTTISQTESDSIWANEFFSNVSAESGIKYNYCPSLSQFAKVRFNTMASNYGISHYGYDQDFSSFYGTIYNAYFAEEVFYPNLGPYGDTPNSYTSYVQSSAPLHWQLLTSGNYSSYGFYIANGPSYVILGPGGGYGAECPVTEIPGPNINVSQFFAQYGCSVQVANETYFVIEVASGCP